MRQVMLVVLAVMLVLGSFVVLSNNNKKEYHKAVVMGRIFRYLSNEESACRINIFNSATDAITHTPWVSRIDAIVILRDAKRSGSKILFYQMECRPGMKPRKIVMLA